MHESVKDLYEQRDTLWVLSRAAERCSPDGVREALAHADSALRKATPTLQADHPRIRQVADSIAGETREPCALMRTLTAFVHRFVAYRRMPSYSSALETLEAGFGDCSEYAVLLAALLRARNVPARVFQGFVYAPSRRAYLGHAWVGVQLDGQWLFADPSHGRFPAADGLVPLLIDDDGTEMREMLRLIDKVTVEYVVE
ncbi:MAG: hypothetical protein GF331_11805 [Chitinivibrionales bacterium]|nr:hypothetical protein [Chitinivibrionales bacterium]